MLPELKEESFSAVVKSEQSPAINTNAITTARDAAIDAVMKTMKQFTTKPEFCFWHFISECTLAVSKFLAD